MEKTGDFRAGESRSDYDMTKIAKVSEGFYVAADEYELKKIHMAISTGVEKQRDSRDVKRATK